MAYKTTDEDHSEAVINQLAESVLGLSDEAIVEEIEETGAAPDEEAEGTRLLLRRKSQEWALHEACVDSVQITIPRPIASLPKR